MGALKGRLSPLAFRVKGTVESWDRVMEELTRGRFQDLDPSTGREQSFGWVSLTDPFETEFTKSTVFYGEHIVGLSLRVDSLTVPPAQLKLHLNRKVKLMVQENGGQKLTKREIEQVRDDLRAEWLRRLIPTIKVFDVIYHTETGRLWFFGRSKGAVETFLDLFFETFGVSVLPDSPFTEAMHRLGEDRAEDLLSLEETRFVSDGDE
jgi:DNA recombination-dependent growth factor C